MPTVEEIKTYLRLLTPDEIRRLLGELEREHGVKLTPQGQDDLRASPAYGAAPMVLGHYGETEWSGEGEYEVILNMVGPQRINVLKVLKETPEWKDKPLSEVSEYLKTAEGRVLRVFDDDRMSADIFARKLTSVGATVRVRARPQ
jgi:ribosomal protein L7/L12